MGKVGVLGWFVFLNDKRISHISTNPVHNVEEEKWGVGVFCVSDLKVYRKSQQFLLGVGVACF